MNFCARGIRGMNSIAKGTNSKQPSAPPPLPSSPHCLIALKVIENKKSLYLMTFNLAELTFYPAKLDSKPN